MLIETEFSYLVLYPKVSSGCCFSIYQHIFSIFHINLAAWTAGSCWAATQSACVRQVGSMSSPHFCMGYTNLMGWRGRRTGPWSSQGREWKKRVWKEKEKLVRYEPRTNSKWNKEVLNGRCSGRLKRNNFGMSNSKLEANVRWLGLPSAGATAP